MWVGANWHALLVVSFAYRPPSSDAQTQSASWADRMDDEDESQITPGEGH